MRRSSSETRRPARARRGAGRVRTLLLALALAGLGGCSFLADEFTFYDVPPPGAGSEPDRAVSGLADRP